METPPPKKDPRNGFALDVWCDLPDEIAVLRAEVAATAADDTRRSGLLLYELGRVQLGARNEPAAAEALLKAYTLRPQFRPTLRLARLLYRERADFALVAKLLDAEARATRDPLTRAALLRQQARILWSRLGDAAEAKRVLEAAARLDASDLTTAMMLELLYAVDGDGAGLRQVVARELETVSDRSIRTALWVQQGMLVAQTDLDEALGALRSAEKNEEQSAAVLGHLEILLEERGLHRELCETLVRQAELPQATPAWRAKLLARAGRIHRDQTGDVAEACCLLHRSLEASPLFAAGWDCFELLQTQEQFAEAVDVGEKLIELESYPPLRASLACQLGDLCRIRLNERQRAIRWYRSCLRWAPSYQPALEGLGRVLEGEDEVEELLEVHRADLGLARDAQAKAQRLYRIAALLERHGRDAEAMEIHREALAARPGFKPSISALERLFTRLERWTELLQLYDQELAHGPDRERVIHILETMASVWHHQLGHVDHALDCYRRILALEPESLGVIAAAARLCAEARRWHDLVDLNQRELGLATDGRRRIDLLQRTGEIWEDMLLNLDEATLCYTRCLEADPTYLPALRALGRIYRQRGRWAELIQMHRAEIAVSTDEEQSIALLYDIAAVQEEELLQELPAADTYRVILERKPGHAPAVSALCRILERHAGWQALAEVQESVLDGLAEAHSKALRLWLAGALRAERLQDVQGAIKDYVRALRLDPQLAAVPLSLSNLLEATGEHHQLADHLTTAMEQAKSAAERAAITLRLADLWDRALDNPRKAVLLYDRIAEEQPSVWLHWMRAQIFQAQGMHRELCGALEQLALAVSDDRVVAELQLRIGRLAHQTALRDPQPHFARAVTSAACRAHAQRAMEQHLRQAGRPGELLELILGRTERTKDSMELACLWTELGDLHSSRGDQTGAEAAYREALIQGAGHLPALWGLGRILEDQQRWRERAELAEREAEGMESNRGMADALLRAAILWEERVHDLDRALPLYKRVLKVHSGHADAFRRLRAIFTAASNWAALAAVIRSQLATTKDQVAMIEMFLELGRLYLKQVKQTKKGVACFRRALDLDPENLTALTALGDHFYEIRDWRQAKEMYSRARRRLTESIERQRLNRRLGDCCLALGEPGEALECYQQVSTEAAGREPALLRRMVEAAEAAGNVTAQMALLKRLAECSEDSKERIEVRKRIARLAQDHLDQDETAIHALEEVLVLDPLDLDAIESLAAAHGRSGNRSAVQQHLQASVEHHRAALARDPFGGVIYRQLGRIFQWQRQLDRLYCACVAQSILGPLDEVEQRFLQDHQRRCSGAPTRALSRGRYDSLVLPESARGPIRDVLCAVGPNLQQRVATDPAGLGLDRSSRVKPGQPLRALCEEMAGCLGGVEFDLWVSRARPDLISAEMLDRPTLVLGSRVAGALLGPPERFRIGRALFLIAENALVLRDLSVRAIRCLFAGLGRAAQPACALPSPGIEEGSVEEETQNLLRVLGRKDRRVLGSCLPALAAAWERVDVGEFARSLSFGAFRAGLIVAGDPRTVIAELAGPGASSSRGPELADLMQYLVSDEYFAARVELGLAGGVR